MSFSAPCQKRPWGAGTSSANRPSPHGAVSDEAVGRWNKFGKPPVTLRSPDQIARFFDGLELLEPGVVSTPRWRPDVTDIGGGNPREVDQFCAVGRKP